MSVVRVSVEIDGIPVLVDTASGHSSASEFVASLDPRQLESDALAHLGDGAETTGEGFVAALRAHVADWDAE